MIKILGKQIYDSDLESIARDPTYFSAWELAVLNMWFHTVGRAMSADSLRAFIKCMETCQDKPQVSGLTDQCRQWLQSDKIPAIKAIRTMTGLGLFEAKFIYDSVYSAGFKSGQSTAKPLDQEKLTNTIKYLETLRA